MRTLNNVGFSHFKSRYAESIKMIRLYVASGMSVWIKTIEENSKYASYEPS